MESPTQSLEVLGADRCSMRTLSSLALDSSLLGRKERRWLSTLGLFLYLWMSPYAQIPQSKFVPPSEKAFGTWSSSL